MKPENLVNRETSSLTWSELETLAPKTTGLLPVGAACKQHGHHLPLGTDALQTNWLCRELSTRSHALIWPIVHYGYYPAFREYPGSPTLDRETFKQTLKQVLDCMTDSGHPTTLIVNSGISTIPIVDEVCSQRTSAWHIYSGPEYRATVTDIKEQNHGGHADEIETSLMLYIAERTVNLELAVPADTEFSPVPLNRRNPDNPNYTPAGTMGNPMLATQAKGKRLARAMLRDGIEILHAQTVGD